MIGRPDSIRCGVDLVDVHSFCRTVEHGGDEFLEMCFAPEELGECSDSLESLAGRFAAKEAVLKALGSGIRGIKMSEVITGKDSRGKPTLRLEGRAWQRTQEQHWVSCDVSISHDAQMACAMVVALCGED